MKDDCRLHAVSDPGICAPRSGGSRRASPSCPPGPARVGSRGSPSTRSRPVSLDPPLVLWSIRKNARRWRVSGPRLTSRSTCCGRSGGVLQALCNAIGGQVRRRAVSYRAGRLPLLADSIASFECLGTTLSKAATTGFVLGASNGPPRVRAYPDLQQRRLPRTHSLANGDGGPRASLKPTRAPDDDDISRQTGTTRHVGNTERGLDLSRQRGRRPNAAR